MNLRIEKNLVEYNSFIGKKTNLIAIDGGIMKIVNNTLQYNGYLSKVLF